jgi:osmotically-inducible protein OsmY
MGKQPDNNKYGLTSKEARMIGLEGGQNVDTKDVELEAGITRQVRGMGGDHIHVTVKAGKVTLSGMADDFGTKREIVHYVQSLPGVFKVSNSIKVVPGDLGKT